MPARKVRRGDPKAAKQGLEILGCAAVIIIAWYLAATWLVNRPLADRPEEANGHGARVDLPEGGSPAAMPSAPAARQPIWVVIGNWVGSGNKSTELFTVGPEWIIGWSTRPDQEYEGTFSIDVHDAQGGYVGLEANISGAGRDLSYKHQAGTYYLEISATQTWGVVIWDQQ
jgi:hypothetical protein